MKSRSRGIRFSTWLTFLTYSLVVLSVLGFLLIALIKPYYRNNRIQTLSTMVKTIEDSLILKKANQKDIDATEKLVMGNNVCTLIFNSNGQTVYSSDSLGQLCMLDKEVSINDRVFAISKNPEELIEVLKQTPEFNIETNAVITNSSMLLAGKRIQTPLADYYLAINTPLEPVASYVDFILGQYIYIALFIALVSLFYSFYLANHIASPIQHITKEANKLANGEYDLELKTDSYTEINELATTLNDATEKLSKIDELRKDLLANVSHDIKTPLTVIKAYAEMIQDISGDDPERRKEHLDVIVKEADYLSKLVNDMQELSKMQSGSIELTKDNFSLNEVVEDVVDLLGHLAEKKGVQVECNLTEVTIYGDELKLSQVVYNFLSNAIKHTSAGHGIFIKIQDSEDMVRLDVVDEGEGIGEEELPYIWDRYFKIDKSFARNGESTGLGLAIAKAILEAHHFRYGVTSKLGAGSDFYFEVVKDYEDEQDLR